jgi:DMSO/TMAO reductase YedYZ molybdopterin-dependent catalytic subunit
MTLGARRQVMRRGVFAFVVLGCLWPFAALAAGASAPIVIDGAVRHPLRLTASDFRAMPPVKRTVTFQTEHGPSTSTYVGVLLWSLLARAEVNDAAKWGELRHVITVTGSDGYFVMISLGEIDPNFGNAPMMVAYERDGEPLDAPRLIAPGDKHGARDVRDLVHLQIR